jgi:hypothetical protein
MTLLLSMILAASVSAKPQSGAAAAAAPAQGAQASSGAPPRDLVFEVPNAITEVKVPGRMEALGVPVQLKAVMSKDSPEALSSYFRETFGRAGLALPPPDVLANPGVPYVVGYDPQTRISYVVLLQQNPDGTTTVLLGKSYVAQRRDPALAGAIAPVFPGGKDIIYSNVEAGQSMSYTASAKADEVRAFYQDVLKKDGYAVVEPGVFEGAGRRLRIQTSERKGGTTHVLVMSQSSQGEPP